MTVDEAIAAANQGDIDAMMNLGAYCMSGKVQGEGIMDTGAEWYAKAARAGNVAAILPLCSYKSVLVLLNREIHGIADEKVVAAWKEIYDWRLYGLKLLQSNALGSESVDLDVYLQDLDEVRYNLALSYMYAGDSDNAFAHVKGFDDIKSRVLLAAIMSENFDSDSEILDAFNRMKIIEGNYEYANAEKDNYEELIYAIVAKKLSEFYRILSEDINHALQILQFVRPFLKTENAIKIIDEEMGHFRKKILGGYDFI